MDSLRKLPAGAVYTKRSGQATVSAQMEGDTVYISAKCDSLQQLVYTLEEELVHIRDELEESKKETSEPTFKQRLNDALTGSFITIIIFLLIKYRRKWQLKNIFWG